MKLILIIFISSNFDTFQENLISKIVPIPKLNIKNNKFVEKYPLLEMHSLSVSDFWSCKYIKNELYNELFFYGLNEVYYCDQNDRNQFMNIYIKRNGKHNKVNIYLPMKDKIIQANNRITLYMVIEKYTCQDLVRYVEQQGYL
jgi:hypothetical protein